MNTKIKEIKIKNFNHNTFSHWGVLKHGVQQGSILGPLHFPLYINDLPKIINGRSKPILFAVDRSIIFTNSNLDNFKSNIKFKFESLNKWFKVNKL